MHTNKIVWSFNRLKAMSPLEIVFRIIRKFGETSYRRKYKKYRPMFITEKNLFNSHMEKLTFHQERFYKKYDDSFRKVLLRDYYMDCSEILTCADSIVNKNINVLNLYSVDFSGYMNWHTAFNEDKNWPLIFSSDIDFRQSEDLGDIRFNWELNRHHFLTSLAAAFFISKDDEYLNSIEEYFYSWVKNNPFMYGVSWISSMEAAIRAFSWIWCLALIENTEGSENSQFSKNQIHIFKHDMETGIKNQIHYVYNNYSRYSSANNHIIVESAIVGIAGILFYNDVWLNSGIKTITREIEKQVTDDGVDREQSIHYQAFVMEAVSLFLLLLKKNDIKYPDIIDKRLERMNDFLYNISNVNGYPPDVGDNDEGRIVSILHSVDKFNYYEYVLQLGSLICSKSYIYKEKPSCNMLFITDSRFNNKFQYKKANGLITYKQGGYSIFRYENGERERLLVFDHGFLGYKTLCAHGHADALSITLSVDGELILIDPGTYIYNIERNWRDYFRKTVNHNTIEIDERNQSEIKGAFLWGRKADVTFIDTGVDGSCIWASAQHYGYSPIVHRREVKFLQPNTFIISDYIKGKCDELVQSFILGKEVQIEQALEKCIILKLKMAHISIYCEGVGSFTMEQVYISPCFGKKEIGTAIRRRISYVENEVLQTTICIDEGLYS